MAIDMFQTRTMLRAIEQIKTPALWLRDTIFGSVETHTTKYVDIDIQRGNRKIAAYVSPLLQGKVVTREGFETNTYEPPYTKEKMITTAQDFLTRDMGTNVYSGGSTPNQKAQKQLGKDLRSLMTRVDRTEEVQAAEAIQTGIVTAVGDGIQATINFGMLSSHKPVLTGTDKWDDLANSDPLADLKVWKNLVKKDSGLVPRDVIMGENAIAYLIRNTTVKSLMDNRRITMGEIKPDTLPDGVTYWGHLNEANLDVWEYTEWYYDIVAATDLPLIDPDKVIMWSRGARATRHYGMIQDLKANFVVPRFAKSWEEEDPSARMLLMQSAPLLAPHQIDGFLCATIA
jgi:Phage major capsid protein E